MDDIMESIEKKEIRPLFIKERIAVYVYCYSYKGTRQLSKFGDVVYTSQKSNYSLLYVNNENLSDLLKRYVWVILKNLTKTFLKLLLKLILPLKRKLSACK